MFENNRSHVSVHTQWTNEAVFCIFHFCHIVCQVGTYCHPNSLEMEEAGVAQQSALEALDAVGGPKVPS